MANIIKWPILLGATKIFSSKYHGVISDNCRGVVLGVLPN